ncbi:MAG: MFS transporter [Saprospiraceae bacterium]|nr:MFS transporter [Saprospiraceae bacterium]
MLTSVYNLYRQSFAGLSTQVWLLSLVNLVNRAGTMVVPFMSMYMTQNIGVSLTKAGFVLTCFGLGSIIGALAGGKLTDYYGHYKVQIITLIFGGFTFFILSTFREYHSICIMTFLLAMINEAYRPANMAAIGQYSNTENRARSSSLVRLTTNLGWAVGASLGGILASIDYKLLFWVDGFTNLFAGLVLFFVLKPSIIISPKNSVDSKTNSSVYKDKDFLIFVLMSFFFALCFFQIFSTYPVFLKKEFGITENQIGTLFALNGLLIAAFEMITVHKLSGKKDELYYVAFGLLFVGTSFLVLNIHAGSLVLLAYLSCLLFTIGEILSMPFMLTYWMNRSDDSNRGQYASLYTVAYSAAHISGPFFGGYIADEFGFSILWLVIFLCCVMTCFGFLRLQKNN